MGHVDMRDEDAIYSWLYEHDYGVGPYVDKLLQFAVPRIRECERILDAGCGPQLFAERMCKKGYKGEITGVDISTYIGEHAKHCPVVRADLADLPFASGSFDGLFCSDVLEHIDGRQIVPVLRELGRVLSKSGFWVFAINTEEAVRKGPLGEALHVVVQPAAWWLATLQANGFGAPTSYMVLRKAVLVRGTRGNAVSEHGEGVS